MATPTNKGGEDSPQWAQLGRLMKSGGMNDPAFLVGMVEAQVDAHNELLDRVLALEKKFRGKLKEKV